MFIAVIAITSLILLVGPFVLGSFLIRRFSASWTLFILGAAAFLTAQMVHGLVYNAFSGTDFYLQYIRDASPVYVLLVYGSSLALIQTALRYLAFWIGKRFAGNQSRLWGGALTMATGFAGADAVLSFAFSSLYLLLGVLTFPAAGSPLPEGVTADQFATMQRQVTELLNLPFIKLVLYSQFIPAVALFCLEAAAMLMTWVGVVQKKWQWLAAAFAWQTAMICMISLSINWMNFYMTNESLYGLNVVVGGALVLLLIAANLGVIYLIYKFILPMMSEDLTQPPTAASLKPLPQQAAPQPPKPTKRLKNTDLK
jgi:uncharacterized membrane protein YhfC